MSAPPTDKPSIYISCASVDSDLAKALRELIQEVVPEISVFTSTSESTIPAGANWLGAVREQLERATMAFFVLTPQSVGRPWQVWEAGLVAGSSGGTLVIPIAFELSLAQIPVPLSTYQSCRGQDREDVRRLMEQLLSDLVPAGPNQIRAIKQLDAAVSHYIDRIGEIIQRRHDGMTDAPPRRHEQPTEVPSLTEQDARMLCELLFRLVAKLRERPEMLQSLEPTAFWAQVRKLQPSASTLDDLRALNADLAGEPAPGPLWASWMRHVRATELAAVVRHPEIAQTRS